MSKQTAVEWLMEQCKAKIGVGFQSVMEAEFQQAKQKEKEQIVKAHGTKRDYSNGSQRDPDIITGEEYYNKTYGGEQ